jgi:hypothetical protein
MVAGAGGLGAVLEPADAARAVYAGAVGRDRAGGRSDRCVSASIERRSNHGSGPAWTFFNDWVVRMSTTSR